MFLSEERLFAVKSLLGKKIYRVILREREQDIPKWQLLIEFTDHTTFEFFSSDTIVPVKGLDCDNSKMRPSDGQDVIDFRCADEV